MSDDEDINALDYSAFKFKGFPSGAYTRDEKGTEAAEKVDALSHAAQFSAIPQAAPLSLVAAAAPSSFTGSLATMNSAKLNSRGFYTATVMMRCQASLRQLNNPDFVPEFKLSHNFTGFEIPGAEVLPHKRTNYHAQGNITLLQVRNGFPGTVGILLLGDRMEKDASGKLVMRQGVRGAYTPTEFSSEGVRAHYIAQMGDKSSFVHVDTPLAHSDIGELTHAYARDYPNYLTKEDVKRAITPLAEHPERTYVKIDSPIHGAINSMRRASMKNAIAKVEAEAKKRAEAEGFDESSEAEQAARAEDARKIAAHERDPSFQPLDTEETLARYQKATIASSDEALRAYGKVENALDTKVNRVPLYNMKMLLVNPFFEGDQSGSTAAQWKKFGEKRMNNGNPLDATQSDKYLDEVHSIHAKVLVEFLPLDALSKHAAKPAGESVAK